MEKQTSSTSSTRSSTRTTKIINPAAVQDKAIQLIKQGYTNFDTEEEAHNDAKENCSAELVTIGGVIRGQTGAGHGHAEMDAIYKLIDLQLEYDDVDKKGEREMDLLAETWYLEICKNAFISCTRKNCCFRCSVILGLLHISPEDKKTTKKARLAMGATQWSISDLVRKFLAAYLNYLDRSSGLDYQHVVIKLCELLALPANQLREYMR